MNKKLLLPAFFVFSGMAIFAQDANKTYAITGDGNGDFLWMNIRQVNIGSGKVEKAIYTRDQTAFVLKDVNSKKGAAISKELTAPTSSMVAAAAYDKKHGKLFFTPMRLDELRWLDIAAGGETKQFYSLNSFSGGNLADEANHITRMVINADGYGYAITNDANHLIRFSTGKNIVVEDLGNIIDADVSAGYSIHNKCTSWGGDMVADAYNKLYIISASHQVFVVNVGTRVATYKGAITELPGNFTTNGAAVDADGNIVVSSANSFSGYYKVNLNDLKAIYIEGSDKLYNASDLANGNLLLQKEANIAKSIGTASLPILAPMVEGRVFPNPVTANECKVSLDGIATGKYQIVITDLSGRNILSKSIQAVGKGQVETIKLSSQMAKGMYLVKITDAAGQTIVTERIVVQ